MESPFKIGTVVRLKSGGPLMTVNQVYDSYLVAKWFDVRHRMHCEQFLFGVLDIVTDRRD